MSATVLVVWDTSTMKVTKIPSIVELTFNRNHWLEQLTGRIVLSFFFFFLFWLSKAAEERGL